MATKRRREYDPFDTCVAGGAQDAERAVAGRHDHLVFVFGFVGCDAVIASPAKHTMSSLENFVWHRVVRWFRKLHRWNGRDVRRYHTGLHGRWTRPSADGSNYSTWPRYHHAVPLPEQYDPQPLDGGTPRLTADAVENPLRGNTHCGFGTRSTPSAARIATRLPCNSSAMF